MQGESILDRIAEQPLTLGPHASAEAEGERLRLARDGDVAWLLLDRRDASVNTFDEAFFEELQAAIDGLEKDPPRALVVRSAKRAGFAMGADVRQFRGLRDAEEAGRRIDAANGLIDRFEALETRRIAVIHGTCAGGGVELALACDVRLAVADAKLSLPEINLGLHPGLGGTARLTHLIDPVEAMTLMLTGRSVDARKAKKLGLADAVIEERHVANAVRAAARGEVNAASGGLADAALRSAPARALAARRMRAKADEKARPEHYPAPRALIALWEAHGGDREAMLAAERESFRDLLVGDTAQALFRVFGLRSRLKEFGRGEHGVAHVHVVGAGAMGGDIAAHCALEGFRVSVADPDAEALGAAYAAACRHFEKRLKREHERRAARDRLIWDFRGDGAGRADLVIEAAPERTDLKREIHAELERRMPERALLATNTSSLPLAELAKGLERPERFLGLHFFNPVAKMPLVEVVRHDGTADDAHGRALAFATAIGKLPAPTSDAPGFLVNRVLTPYLLEAMAMLDEGAPKERLDAAAEAFGMPVGPVELADQVGLDICVDVAESLGRAKPDAYPPLPDWLKGMVEEGKLGRKSGAGFYRYKDGEKVSDGFEGEPDAETTDRLILPMLNAAISCLREGVVEDADVADAGLVFGAGFAPFRGGPIAYARARGVEEVRERLIALAARHGDRFEPDAGWSSIEEE